MQSKDQMRANLKKNLPMVINVIVAVVGWQIVRGAGGDEAVVGLIIMFLLAAAGQPKEERCRNSRARPPL